MVPTHFFTRWRMRTDVYYIDPVTLERLSSGTSTHRRVEVILQKQTASGTWQTLAAKQRTVAWVPVYAG
jgi:hypothetical protein